MGRFYFGGKPDVCHDLVVKLEENHKIAAFSDKTRLNFSLNL
jgi:hypothetical protein